MIILCEEIDRNQIDLDPSGWWFLIRPNFQHGYIEVAACHNDGPHPDHWLDEDESTRKVKEVFRGRSAQDIYHHILEKTKYVTLLTHAAYLGKELKKAELQLALGIKEGYQE